MVKNKASQQRVYLGHPGVNRIIAGGRASFHWHRGVINGNKITESWLNNQSKNTPAAEHRLGVAKGHKAGPHIFGHTSTPRPLAKGSCKHKAKMGCFCGPWPPALCVPVAMLILLQGFRNGAQLTARTSLPH